MDLGTGGPKVGLVSLTGAIAAAEHAPVVTTEGPDGRSTQDAEEWWQLIVASAHRLLDAGTVRRDQVVAVSCTGQWGSTVPVDPAGRPVGECILWSDTRGGPLTRSAVGGPVAGYDPIAAARWILHSGGAPSTSGADPIGHILFLEHRQPDVASAARWYLEPVDYLSMRFTGVAAATPASMAAAWLTDNRRPDRLAYDPVLVRGSGVPLAKLPPLRATGSIVAPLSTTVADDLGLRPDVVVVAGTPDLHSACAGSGAVLARQAHLAISTTSWVSCPYPAKKTDPIRQIATVPGFAPGLYLVANNQESGGRALDWLRERLADDDGPPTYEQLMSLAATAATGSNGVLFTPWLAGERSPVDDRNARGGLHNLSLRTTRADIVRAVLEGVALNSRWLTGAVERFVGGPLSSVRVIGGGATSALWCSIFADVLDRTVERVAEPRLANLRGCALLAASALGQVTFSEFASFVPVAERHEPDPVVREVYDEHYRAFTGLYRAQRRVFGKENRRRARRLSES